MTPMFPNTAEVEHESRIHAATVAADPKLWEAQFEAIPGITRIEENNFARLRGLLATCEDADSYLTSPVYYAFTGRKGLWVYENDNAFVIACRHPNVPEQLLIFPQLVKSDADLVTDLLGLMPKPIGGVRIARAKAADAVERAEMHFDNRHVSLERQDEEVLDWKFPIRILDTVDVASMSGHKYMKTRNHIRQLKKHTVEVLPFDAINHSRALERLLHRWANYNADNREEYEHLYAPYETLFSQSLDKPYGLAGQMIFVDGEMQSVGLWDVSNPSLRTANVYVNFCNTEIRGLSEFSMAKCCETLSDQGVRFLNLGGSETESLDAYKRKFNPVVSIDLCSIEAKIKDDFRNAPKRTVNPAKRHQIIIGGVANA